MLRQETGPYSAEVTRGTSAEGKQAENVVSVSIENTGLTIPQLVESFSFLDCDPRYASWEGRGYSESIKLTLPPYNGRVIGQNRDYFKFAFPNDGFCYFFPTLDAIASWNGVTQYEKACLDKIDKLGIKTLNFDIVLCKVRMSEGFFYIMLRKSRAFTTRCEEESLLIYNNEYVICGGNPAIDDEISFGQGLDLTKLSAQFSNEEYVRKLFQKIIIEYAIAHTFSLPIFSTHYGTSKAKHFCFELTNDPNEPPIARYMFWNIAQTLAPTPTYRNTRTHEVTRSISDPGTLELKKSIFIPYVPTIAELKKGKRDGFSYNNEDLSRLVEDVVEALWKCDTSKFDDTTHQQNIQDAFLKAIDDEAFLAPALEAARLLAIQQLLEISVDTLNEDGRDRETLFIKHILGAITTGDLRCVTHIFELHTTTQPSIIPNQSQMEAILNLARERDHREIFEYFTDKFKPEQASQSSSVHEGGEQSLEEENSQPVIQTHVTRLSASYHSFFCNTLPDIALSPYSKAKKAGRKLFSSKNESGEWIEPDTENAGKAICIILSVIPILPTLTLATIAVAIIAAILAALSTVITYPSAAFLDWKKPSPQSMVMKP